MLIMIEELIAKYLFQNKTCPLPGVGSLSIGDRTASYVLGEKQIYPPMPYISFSSAERSIDGLLKYISRQQDISPGEAEKRLRNYCSKLNNLDAYAEEEIPDAGKFYVDVEGSLVFKQAHFPDAFLPPVHAEKIIHPEATHAILVGDKESNSAIMAEFYNDAVPVKKYQWWIWAIVLFALAAAMTFIYFNNGPAGSFGNGEKVPVAEPSPTYSVQTN